MKKVMSFAAFLLMAVAAMGQQPVMTFTKTEHDFGKINEADGRVTTVFEFKNEGMTPLVLSNVRASCGCTTPKWTREPVEPGQTGQITVTYNPNGRPGRFQKTITITSNATEATKRLYIKGEVIPKPAKPVDQYPVKMGELSMKKNSLSFGNMKHGDKKMLEIEYANQTEQPVKVDFLMRDQDSYLKTIVTLAEVQPKQTGKLQVALESEECPLYGPVDTKIYMMVNGKRQLTDEYAVHITGNIQEDFSGLTVEQRQQAPIVEIERNINLGTVKAGKKANFKVSLKNAGINPLTVRRIVLNDPLISIAQPKSAVKGGHHTDLKVEIKPSTETAQYSRAATLITNDPENPVITLKINWTVE